MRTFRVCSASVVSKEKLRGLILTIPSSLVLVLYVFNKIDSLWIEELDILDRLDNVVPGKYDLSLRCGHNLR